MFTGSIFNLRLVENLICWCTLTISKELHADVAWQEHTILAIDYEINFVYTQTWVIVQINSVTFYTTNSELYREPPAWFFFQITLSEFACMLILLATIQLYWCIENILSINPEMKANKKGSKKSAPSTSIEFKDSYHVFSNLQCFRWR
jgi:hypothetical protein